MAYSFTQPIDMRVNEMILGVRGDLALKIFGTDLKVLNEKAQQIIKILESIPGSQDVYTPQNSGVQYLQIKIDRAAAGRLGLDITEIENILMAQREGRQQGIVQEGQELEQGIDFLPKPFLAAELLARVRAVLDRPKVPPSPEVP